MALLGNTFDPSTAEDMSYEPIPAGFYIAKIIESDLKITSSGTGQYIKNVWEILEGDDAQYNGRKIYQNLNIINDNETAVKIAKSLFPKFNSDSQSSGIQCNQRLIIRKNWNGKINLIKVVDDDSLSDEYVLQHMESIKELARIPKDTTIQVIRKSDEMWANANKANWQSFELNVNI